jgi:ABC-type multidrug transport system ATPase subunit
MSVITTNFTNTARVIAMATCTPVIQTSRLSKLIDDRSVLRDLDLRIDSGEYVGILGANGAGKSTLLKILATLMPPTSGDLALFGKKVTRDSTSVRAQIGMIGHQSMLYRDLTARENLVFFAKLYGIESPEDRAIRLLDVVGMRDRANDPVKSYSRGMTQRVAIARALLPDPQLILADEPFDGLDAPSANSLEQLLSDLNLAGKTIVLVNHDIEQTLRIAERALVLREGRVALDQPAGRLYAKEVLAELW